MSKLDTLPKRQPQGAIQTTGRVSVTYEGGPAWLRDAKSELFLLAVSNFVGEDTFYEDATNRDTRFVDLVHKVTQEDADWVARLVAWLRGPEANMRSASVVAALEYVRAGGANGRAVVASALQRADEPAAALAYWNHRYGRRLPMAVKRGVADAATRLYTDYATMKYDGKSRNWRMGDVIELVRPRPRDEAQSKLFEHLLNKRHGRKLTVIDQHFSQANPATSFQMVLRNMSENDRRHWLRSFGSEGLKQAGFTWEQLSGWLPGGMDKEAWEFVIPNMGYMALLRNLRNFDEAEVSDEVAAYVNGVLADPENVAKSRQMPFRFKNAYDHVPSERWSAALEAAFNHSVNNIPAFRGGTLVLTDVSGSMSGMGFTHRSAARPIDVAALFGGALAKRGRTNVDFVVFGTNSMDITDKVRTTPILRLSQEISRMGDQVGHGTDGYRAIADHFVPERHERVIILTDGQMRAFGGRGSAAVNAVKKLYNFNLNGYAAGGFESGKNGHYELGGITDSTFKMIPLVEAGNDQDWPF